MKHREKQWGPQTSCNDSMPIVDQYPQFQYENILSNEEQKILSQRKHSRTASDPRNRPWEHKSPSKHLLMANGPEGLKPILSLNLVLLRTQFPAPSMILLTKEVRLDLLAFGTNDAGKTHAHFFFPLFFVFLGLEMYFGGYISNIREASTNSSLVQMVTRRGGCVSDGNFQWMERKDSNAKDQCRSFLHCPFVIACWVLRVQGLYLFFNSFFFFSP
jgi:hypothetical protein